MQPMMRRWTPSEINNHHHRVLSLPGKKVHLCRPWYGAARYKRTLCGREVDTWHTLCIAVGAESLLLTHQRLCPDCVAAQEVEE